MPFDPWSGQYYPDKNPGVDYSNFGQQQQQQSNLSTTYNFNPIGNGTVPNAPVTQPPAGPTNTDNMNQPNYGGTNPAPPSNGVMDPNSDYFKWWLSQHSGLPTAPNPYSDNSGVPITGTNKPNGVDFSSPTTVPALTNSAPPTPATATPAAATVAPPMNPGNDPNNPPDQSGDWFWSGTAGHWVDRTGRRDATGRNLTAGEQSLWQNYDRSRASGTLTPEQLRMMQWGNTQYPTGFTDVYKPPMAAAQAATPGAAAPGAAAAATTAAAPGATPNPLDPAWDYNKPFSVPWQAFQKNVFAESNGNPLSFQELQGVLDEKRMADAEKFGWTAGVPANADANQVYRAAIQLGQQDPTSDYAVVRLNVNGQPMYAALKREQDPAAQYARGYISPAMATQLAQQRGAGGGGGGGGGGNSRGYSTTYSNRGGGGSNTTYRGGGSGGGAGGNVAMSPLSTKAGGSIGIGPGARADANGNPPGHQQTVRDVPWRNGEINTAGEMYLNGQWIPAPGGKANPNQPAPKNPPGGAKGAMGAAMGIGNILANAPAPQAKAILDATAALQAMLAQAAKSTKGGKQPSPDFWHGGGGGIITRSGN